MTNGKTIKYMTETQKYFEKFKDMEPYFEINEEEWTYIKETFPKEEVKEVLADILMDYPLPTAEISEVDAYNAFMKLKGIRWNELLIENEWFPRKESESAYPLTFRGKPQYIRRLNIGNNASNGSSKKTVGVWMEQFHQAQRYMGNESVYGYSNGWIIHSKVPKDNKKRTKSLFKFKKIHLFSVQTKCCKGIL